MKVDIWSDIRCPFCYVGKKKFEKALEQFPNADK
ncbi:MAG: DsbA family oxidoreductase, partial [Kaistella sp.]